MPFYRCLIPPDSLSYEQRREIAVAFTDVHCGISAAPRSFVQVVFLEVSGSGEIADSHGSGAMRYDTPYFIAGGNRAGRHPRSSGASWTVCSKNSARSPAFPQAQSAAASAKRPPRGRWKRGASCPSRAKSPRSGMPAPRPLPDAAHPGVAYSEQVDDVSAGPRSGTSTNGLRTARRGVSRRPGRGHPAGRQRK